MSATFYRKYRPERFADIIGQDTATSVLTQSLIRDKVAHAYLLTGPRGTGKTTLARLFARALNCSNRDGAEPCGKCAHCQAMQKQASIDVVEIDAASHTGVDHIRELKETLATAPVLGSHKVYIIDEAHMLSLGAWNALLKTLEEPPAHVVFLLATTNATKVPETILSRSLRLDLARFPLEQLLTKLRRIAEAEDIDIDDASLLLIARSAQGGMRDAEVLFTQIATLELPPIREDRTALLLGTASFESNRKLLQAVADQSLPNALDLVRKLGESGMNLDRFVTALLHSLRHILFVSVNPAQVTALAADFTPEEQAGLQTLATSLGSDRIIACMEAFQEASALMKTSPLPELPLEIALVKLIPVDRSSSNSSSTPTPPSAGSSVASKPGAVPKTAARASSPAQTTKAAAKPKEPVVTPTPSAENIDWSKVGREWRSIVAHAKKMNASLGVALSTARLSTGSDTIATLEVKYPFHKERLEKTENRLTIDTAFATILGFRVPWEVRVAETAEPAQRPPIIDQALEALGGQLVMNE